MKNNVIIDKSGRAHYIPELWDVTRTRVLYGNTKTGLPSINLLAGDINHFYSGSIPGVLKKYFNLICGTCAQDCPGCYAKKITRNIEPFIKFALNTIEAKTDPARFFSLVEKELYNNLTVAYKVVRIHDSGDFFNNDYFIACMDFINRHPETRFGAYTKANNIVLQYGVDNLPENLTLSCSPWAGVAEPIGDLPQFIYDNKTDPELATLKHCPAVDKNGKRTGVTCAQCLHCYTAKRGDRRAVYAH